MSKDEVSLEFISSISEVSAADWDRLACDQGPFLRHAFLNALETSDSVGAETGWQPFHMLIKRNNTVIGAAPLYIKGHSYGEYVFDFAWANAYQQHGLKYYPKLLNAIPFTPVTGGRVLFLDTQQQQLFPQVISALKAQVKTLGLSGFHSLFLAQAPSNDFTDSDCLQRLSVQFQWYNKGYNSWQDFVDTMTARRRKSIRKERQKVLQQNVITTRAVGHEISAQDMAFFYQCYRQTYLKRSGHEGYLKQAFFTSLLSDMADALMLVTAKRDEQPIAAALYLRDEKQLSGRYWGALDEVDGLHFECCYYQGIEFCIEQNIQVFNPGTQGEHKILRGFEPTFCYSNHWLARADFHDAVARFLQTERHDIEAYKAETDTLLPFKSTQS